MTDVHRKSYNIKFLPICTSSSPLRLDLEKSVKDIDDFKPVHVELIGYDPHPALKAELSVSGGFIDKKP